ncbi:MAG: single-stranded-DNA-specific exonuclease, partial [Patescibacteria group bacterium]|nr:single-stranded-DNA-specific exonuclease [Patescibacteria group bacterium]
MSKSYTVRESLEDADRGNLKSFSDTLAHLLFHRGIKSEDEAVAFMSPNYDRHVHDPFLLLGMEKAVQRILQAINNGEKIAIFSDYDADGVPGAVVLHDFFKLAGFHNFLNYIPDRQEEGFGLSVFAIEEIKNQGATLLITIDCGITALEEVDFANSLGIDVIITDHHLPSEIGLPKSFANINPKISPDYPEQMLCGAGVIFKVVQAIILKERFGLAPGAEKWLLDMVGIATLSDMVPIKGENRAFACFGLMVLRKTRRVGLLRLLKTLKIDPKRITEDDVGFMITPRINAASRMGISYDAFKLLTTTDEAEAEVLVKNLEKANTERKSTTAYLAKEVRKMIEAKYSPYFSNKVIVAGNPSWQPSILGLVAGSLAESESKPVFLWGKEGSK